jgi:hypothetical protein
MYFPEGFKVVLLFITRYYQTTNDVRYIYESTIHMLNTLEINTGIKNTDYQVVWDVNLHSPLLVLPL